MMVERKISQKQLQLFIDTMRMKKFQLLCFVTLAVVFFWIIWFNRSAVSTISRDELLVDSPQQNIFLNHDLPGKKPNKDASSKNKSNSVVAILDLPTNLNSVDLRGWEVFGSEEAMLWAGRKETESEDERPTPALTFKDRVFYLNEMPFRIFSGAMHYFRVVPEYWMDRLKKLKACGLNTVETYVPWNLHEPSPGIFDFKGILNLRKFINMAAELGLYVILRPGPYICSEFEFGGLPGWLLADPHMRVRTNYRNYIKYVNKYWSVLLPMMLDLQFTEGGPIIMFQVENEYSSYGVDHNHVKLLLYMMREYGVRELVVTSDNVFQLLKDHPEFDVSKYALNTINGHKIDENHLEFVQKQNQHFPIMVMELWCGWFDWWRHDHTTGNIKTLKKTLTYLLDHGGSFNLYMFLGGTNFGFTSGAANLTRYEVVTTSYDYGAALSEAGDTTPKYFLVRDELLKFYKKLGIPYLPEVPPNLPKASYGNFKVSEIMEWSTILSVLPMQYQHKELNYMETYVDITTNQHVTQGYIIYSHLLRPGMKWDRKTSSSLMGYVSGRLTAILDGETFYQGSDYGPIRDDDFLWDKKVEALSGDAKKQNTSFGLSQVDLMVENQGRINYVNQRSSKFDMQRRGLKGPILKNIFGIKQEEWSIRMLHFDKQQCQSLSQSPAWMTMKAYNRRLEDLEQTQKTGPALYKVYINIDGKPADTFVKMKGWTKGVIIVNNFNIGRYWYVGPQQTLYLPAPVLKQGANEIIVFEERSMGPYITLQDTPELG